MDRLRLTDFRDLDLMLAVDETNGDGITNEDLRDKLGMPEEALHAVASRCSWMRRFGVFQKDERTGAWLLSPGGQRVLQAKRKAAGQSKIVDVPDEAMIDAMAHITSRYRLGDPMVATLLRREFQYGTSPGSAAWR